MLCGQTQKILIAVELNWSLTYLEKLATNNETFKFTIELTMTTRLPLMYHARSPWLNGEELHNHLLNPPSASEAPFPWAPLTSAAFRPKTYNLTLTRGSFIEPFQLFIKKPFPLFQEVPYRFSPYRYRYQLTFENVSPYPPREEWVERTGYLENTLDYQRFWEKRVFVKDVKDKTWADTLDLGWWLSPSIGELHTRT